MIRYEVYTGRLRNVARVLVVVDEGDPAPTALELAEAELFNVALAVRPDDVEIVSCDDYPGCRRVFWKGQDEELAA